MRLPDLPLSRPIMLVPQRPLGWAIPLEEYAEPADIWHGMWAGSLPALTRLQRKHGGRTIYDSRDVYMRSRDFESAGLGKGVLAWLERRWAHATDRVLTVNDSYADLLVGQLRIERPSVVMNCPVAWQPPHPRPDLIRERLGLSHDVQVVLYQGQLISERGIEQAMEAILLVPDAVLVLLGHGPWMDRLTRQIAEPPFVGRVAILSSVPPESLLWWTASADVAVMAIQPTSLNHRFTTPQKLFESIAAGIPVVASDLPGMAEIVRGSDVGLVCDPTAPAEIAAAIRSLLAEPVEVRDTRRRNILALAHDRYDWEHQWATLDAVYRGLVADGGQLATGDVVAGA
jgi:glycosyltransferase involved in cell wall biosynthesis